MSNDNKDFERILEKATREIVMEVFKNTERACLFLEEEAKKLSSIEKNSIKSTISSDVKMTETEIVGTVSSKREYFPNIYKGTKVNKEDHLRIGENINPSLDKAKINNKDKINKILGGGN